MLLDFGKAFGRYSAYFDGVFIKDRAARGLLDPIALGLIPPLRGLLREDLIPALSISDLQIQTLPPEGRQRKPRVRVDLQPARREAFWDQWSRRRIDYRDLRRDSGPAVDLILVSHAHQDHISDLEFVAAAFPILGSRITAFISKVLQDVGPWKSGAAYLATKTLRPEGVLESLSDIPYAARPWQFLSSANLGESAAGSDPLDSAEAFWNYAGSRSLLRGRPEATNTPRILHWPVDHSLFGAVGVAVETEAGWVAYSGDLRFHGEQGEASWDFADGLVALGVRALLCEGTRLTHPNVTTEAMVAENCLAAVREAEGQLVVADFAPRNVKRLITFLSIASQTGRRLLVQPKDAYLLRAMHLADALLPDVMVQPATGMYADPKIRAGDWEAMVRTRYRGVTAGPEEVTRSPGEFILAFSLADVADILDLDFLQGGIGGGVYIFSNSQAYDEEQKVDLVRLWNWTQRLGLRMVGLSPSRTDDQRRVTEVEAVQGFHASGHAGQPELVEFVRRARPEVLIPIHTDAAHLWVSLLEGTGVKVALPEYARPLEVV